MTQKQHQTFAESIESFMRMVELGDKKHRLYKDELEKFTGKRYSIVLGGTPLLFREACMQSDFRMAGLHTPQILGQFKGYFTTYKNGILLGVAKPKNYVNVMQWYPVVEYKELKG